MTVTSSSSFIEEEIATQPTNWLAAREVAAAHRAALPQPGERVAVVGCGTSYYMAQAYAALRESAGLGVTDAWTPTEARLGRGYDRILAITRSGTTTEVLDLLASVGGRLPASVISSSAGTPALDLAVPILTADVDEQSVVQTRFATSTLALLRWHLGEDLTPVIAQAEAVLAAGDEALGPAVDAEQITFVGPRLDHRHRRRGRPEAARVGPALDRVVLDDGVPARADQHQRARPGRVGLRRAGRRVRRRHRRDRRPAAARADRRDGRPAAGAPPVRRPRSPGGPRTPTSRAT